MSDKLTVLKNQAKQSLQQMTDSALLLDAASDYRRHLFKTSFRFITVSLHLVMFGVCLYKAAEVESVRRAYGVGFATFLKTGSRSFREMYAPDVYEEDLNYRRREAHMFRDE